MRGRTLCQIQIGKTEHQKLWNKKIQEQSIHVEVAYIECAQHILWFDALSQEHRGRARIRTDDSHVEGSAAPELRHRSCEAASRESMDGEGMH